MRPAPLVGPPPLDRPAAALPCVGRRMCMSTNGCHSSCTALNMCYCPPSYLRALHCGVGGLGRRPSLRGISGRSTAGVSGCRRCQGRSLHEKSLYRPGDGLLSAQEGCWGRQTSECGVRGPQNIGRSPAHNLAACYTMATLICTHILMSFSVRRLPPWVREGSWAATRPYQQKGMSSEVPTHSVLCVV